MYLDCNIGIVLFLGLLSMVVDLYANAGVPNILLCPISISYDRVLEEPLFAYELLGIPKPKESLRVRKKCKALLMTFCIV